MFTKCSCSNPAMFHLTNPMTSGGTYKRFHEEELVIVLRAYLDGSGTKENNPVVIVGGFLADDVHGWKPFDDAWKSFLDDFELGRFHVAPFLAHERPFDRWPAAKYDQAQARICEIFKKANGLFGIVTGVSVKAFDEWIDDLAYYADPDPYYFCLSRCLRLLIRGIKKSYGPDDGIAIYIDKDEKRDRLGYQLAEWHERRLRIGKGVSTIDAQRETSTHYVSSFQYRPLQAADILAHSIFQQAREFVNSGELPPDPPFLAAMKEGQIPLMVNFLHTKEMLEIDSRSRLAADIEG